MGTLYNISSIFILLPLFIITDIYEILATCSVAFVSWLYHSNREHDALNNLYLHKYTNNLYYIDRLQIQIAFTYLFLKNVSFTYIYQILLYLFSIYNYNNTNILGILIISNIIIVSILHTTNIVIFYMGFILVHSGYQGMPLSENNHKITEWSEISKCMWHCGMGLVVCGLLLE